MSVGAIGFKVRKTMFQSSRHSPGIVGSETVLSMVGEGPQQRHKTGYATVPRFTVKFPEVLNPGASSFQKNGRMKVPRFNFTRWGVQAGWSMFETRKMLKPGIEGPDGGQ